MAEEVIGLLFGVEGGGLIDGKSGKQSVEDLTKIVNEINSGKSTVPKIKFHFDTSEATKAVDDLKKKLKDIEKIASIKVTYSNGGNGGKGVGGGLTQELKQEMAEFLALQKRIRSTEINIGKLKMKDGNAQQIAEYTSQLSRLEEEYARLMQTFMKKVTGNADVVMFDDIKKFSKLSASIKQVADDTLAAARAKQADQEAITHQKQKYDELLAIVKQWTQQSKMAAKISEEYEGVTRNLDGSLNGTVPDFSATIDQINDTVKAMKQLHITFDSTGEAMKPNADKFASIAKSIGITKEQYETLLSKIQTGSAIVSQNVQNVHRSTQNAWDKQVRNVSQQIDRMYDTISKNPAVKKMADDLRKYMQAGSGNVGELKNKFDEFTRAAVESGASLETWGDKFKKTFADKVRSGLVAAVTAFSTKYLREIYQNVVKIDEAMVNLQIASGKTREEVKPLIKEYAALAKQLGATTIEVAEGADTWLRQGYSAKDANTLIKNSTMLSKLGQMEAAEASKALTSAMKGYKVEVKDSIGIVDKFTAVDMEAAASAGDIATAMAETATSANIAGVSMDRLIGYLAVVKEVTQDGAESVGTFYKTLFARMNSVKAGKFVDDETGESLNDVETVLGKLDISLRNVNGTFRDSDEVLDEVGSRWNEFDNVQQHAIATAFAGTKQQEKFIALMANYETAMKYATTATNSTGTALEKYSAYTEGINGKMKSLKVTFEELSMTFLDGDLVKFAVDILNLIVSGLNAIGQAIQYLGGLKTAILAFVAVLAIAKGGLILYNLELAKTAALSGILAFFQKLKAGIKLVVDIIPNAIVAWKAYAAGTVSASTAMQASVPVIGLVLAALTALVGGLSLVGNVHQENIKKIGETSDTATELSDSIYDLTQQYIALSKAVQTDDSVKQNLLDTQAELIKKLGLEKYEVDELVKKYGSYTEAIKQASIAKLQEEERDIRGGLSVASDALVDAAKEHTFKRSFMEISGGKSDGYFGTSEETRKEQISAYYALKALEDQGFISNSSYSTYTDKDGRKYSQGFSRYARYKYDMTTPTGIMAAYEDLGKMLDVVGDTSGQNNFVYKALYDEYSGMTDVVKKYKEEVGDLNTNLAQQYTVVGIVGKELPKTQDEFTKYRNGVVQAAVASGEFVGTQQDIEYAIDSILRQQSEFSAFYNQQENAGKGSTVALKSAYDILGKVQGGFDVLSQALDDMDEYGSLSADTLSKLLDPKNGYPALAKYLTMTANGYTISADALEQYIKEQRDPYVRDLIMAEEGTEAYDIAYQNLERFLAVTSSLQLTKEIERETKALENERDAREDQLDKYKELIDLRKDLLDSYAEELEYQKELEKKQRTVSTLQTKLSVARLDSSAAGRARVRELEAELKEAQEELEDFTFEHAIDVLTDQLDNQYKQYEDFIKTKVAEITDAINEVTAAIKGNAQSSNEQIEELKKQYKTEHPGGEDDKTAASAKEAAFKAAQDYVTSHGMLERDKNRWRQDPNFRPLLSTYLDTGGSLGDIKGKTNTVRGGTPETYEQWSEYWYKQNAGVYGPPPPMPYGWTVPSSGSSSSSSSGTTTTDRGNTSGSTTPAQKEKMVEDYDAKTGLRIGTKTYTQEKYDSKVKVIDGVTYLSTHENGGQWSDSTDHYIKKDEGYSITKIENGNVYMDWHSFKPVYRLQKYHAGGFVGDFSALTSNEEFAKLLKGEFVTTPAQMKRFMEETLPRIANYTATGGSNEFNAPLIEVLCENVTSESLPELERVVNEAVKEIKKQFDSGMSRTGYKRQATKRLNNLG